MAGSKLKLTHWEVDIKRKLDDAAKHPDFSEDFIILIESKHYPELLDMNVKQFIKKYDLPKLLYISLKKSILLDEPITANIPTPIIIVSEVDGEVLPTSDPKDSPKLLMETYALHVASRPRKRVFLDILSADVKRSDIDDFLDIHFAKDIKPKLKLLDKGRKDAIKPKLNTQFYRVAKLYKELHAAGKRRFTKTIQDKTKVDLDQIQNHIETYRSHKKYDLLTPADYRKIIGQKHK